MIYECVGQTIFLSIVCGWFYRLISTKLYLTLSEKKQMQYSLDYVWSLFLSSVQQYTYKVEVCKFSWRGNWRYSLEKGMNHPLLFGILIQAPSNEGPEIWFQLLFIVRTADVRIMADGGLERRLQTADQESITDKSIFKSCPETNQRLQIRKVLLTNQFLWVLTDAHGLTYTYQCPAYSLTLYRWHLGLMMVHS